MFYLTTGFHGLHVTGGLIAFIFFLVRTTMGRFTPAQATAAIVVSYYWHFVDVVWIGLFAMIYLLAVNRRVTSATAARPDRSDRQGEAMTAPDNGRRAAARRLRARPPARSRRRRAARRRGRA